MIGCFCLRDINEFDKFFQPMKLNHKLLPKSDTLNKILLLIMFLVASGLVSLFLGQDANYDLKNYHFYNPWAFLDGRFHADLSPAGIQTYTSPLMDVPYYLLVKYLGTHPRLVAFVMGLPYGILVYLSFLIVWHMTRVYNFTRLFRVLATTTLVIFSATAAGTFCVIGTTFNDIPTACLVLASIYLLMTNKADSIKIVLLAGSLAGLGAALKLTVCIFAPAIMVALFGLFSNWKICLRQSVFFAGGWWLAFLIAYGWFGYQYYVITGSPVFPMFESIFPSKWLAGNDLNLYGLRLPQSLTMAIFYPFYWAKMNVNIVAEPPFADPKFAIVFCLTFLAAILSCYRILYSAVFKSNRHNLRSDDNSGENKIFPGRFLFIFFIMGYILWEYMFCALRYAVVLEALLGVICLMSVYSIFSNLQRILLSETQRPDPLNSQGSATATKISQMPLMLHSTVLFVFILIGTLLTTHQPDFGRVPYAREVFEVTAPQLPDNTQVIILGNQGAYMAPLLAKGTKGVSFIGLTNILMDPKSRNYPYWEVIKNKISQHAGPRCVLLFPQYAYFEPILTDLGINVRNEAYAAVTSNMDPRLKIRLYNARLVNQIAVTDDKNMELIRSAFYQLNNLRMNHWQDQFLTHGWSVGEEWFCWNDGNSAKIQFVVPPQKKAPTRISIAGFPQGAQHVKLLLNGQIVFDGIVETETALLNIAIPIDSLRTDGTTMNELDFRFPDARSPDNGDPRKLAFAFIGLELH